MSYLNHLPIWRDANRLLLAIEQAVRGFPRYHKYTLGTELRHQAMEVCRLILRAADRRETQLERIQALVEAVDDLKLQVQLAKELQAFKSFNEFQTIAALAVDLGKQSGGWRKRLQQSTASTSGSHAPAPSGSHAPAWSKSRRSSVTRLVLMRYLQNSASKRVSAEFSWKQ